MTHTTIYLEKDQDVPALAHTAESPLHSIVSNALATRLEVKAHSRNPPALIIKRSMPEDIKWIDRVLFAPRIAAEFRVARPFEVKISKEDDGSVTALIAELEEFGSGISLGESLEDLRLTLAELFVGLEERQTSLSRDLEEVRKRSSSHLEPITAG